MKEKNDGLENLNIVMQMNIKSNTEAENDK